jgi:hypothetical protein
MEIFKYAIQIWKYENIQLYTLITETKRYKKINLIIIVHEINIILHYKGQI